MVPDTTQSETGKAKAPARRTQAERTATAQRRMIRAAIELIGEQGYSRTTLAEVGKRAGYTGGLVSHHFGSKEGLLEKLLDRVAHRFYEDQILPAVDSHEGLEALDRTIDVYLRELRLRPERMRALYVLMGEALGPLASLRDAFAKLNEGYRSSVRTRIEQGIEAGLIRRDVDAAAEAAVIVSMLRGAAHQWMIDPDCFDLEEVADRIKAAVHSTLAVPAKAPR